MSGPVSFTVYVPAGSTKEVGLAAGTYYYTVTAANYNPSSGTKTYAAWDEVTWTWYGSP